MQTHTTHSTHHSFDQTLPPQSEDISKKQSVASTRQTSDTTRNGRNYTHKRNQTHESVRIVYNEVKGYNEIETERAIKEVQQLYQQKNRLSLQTEAHTNQTNTQHNIHLKSALQPFKENERRINSDILGLFTQQFSPSMLSTAAGPQENQAFSCQIRQEAKPQQTGFFQNNKNAQFISNFFVQPIPRKQLITFAEERAYQIQAVAATQFISKDESISLATFIENHYVLKTKNYIFSYEKKSKTELSHTLLLDGRCQKIFIFLKSQGYFKPRVGSFKKVTSCIVLPFSHSQPGNIAVQKVTNDRSEKRHFKAFSREISIMKAVDVPSLPVISSFTYTKVKGSDRIGKSASIEPYFTHDLSKFPNYEKTPENLTQIILQLLQTVRHIHSKGYIHGDIKPNNILWRKNDSSYTATLTDFGFAFKYTEEEAIGSLQYGYYGSLWFTAPEVFGAEPSAIDLQKAEVWALGFTLYQLIHSEYIPTHQYLQSIFNNGPNGQWGRPNMYEKGQYALRVEFLVNAKLRDIENNTTISAAMRAINEVILGLLIADPEKRLSLDEAIEKLRMSP